MGELDEARRDFDRGIELAREHGDPEVESYIHANRALVEAIAAESGGARRGARLGLEIADRSGNAIAIVACSTPHAVAQAGSGRFAEGLREAETGLATIRRQRMGLYYEPVLLATMARCRLGLGQPDEARAAAEEAVEIMARRGLTTCALLAPLTLAEVLLAGPPGPAAGTVEAVLGTAAETARRSHARLYEPLIDRQRAVLARRRDGPPPGRR
ncbi:MAG TPA: hypothetical protein VHL53_08995 [Acidimicrobiia bacterium]|nr:hypothetical protein [Acidimicrobiia bacterium]